MQKNNNKRKKAKKPNIFKDLDCGVIETLQIMHHISYHSLV